MTSSFFCLLVKVLNSSPFMSNVYFSKFIPKCYMFFVINLFFLIFPWFIWFKTIKNQLILYNNIFTQMFTEFAYLKKTFLLIIFNLSAIQS